MQASIALALGSLTAGFFAGWYVGWLNGVPGVRKELRQWAIGIYTGDSPFTLGPAAGVKNPVLTAEDVTDARAQFVADPFMVYENETWYMFLEMLDRDRQKGNIALATSTDGFNWSYRQIVLSEPFHMAYPHVFKWKGEYYMIPDTPERYSIRLYRASNFPTEWSFVTSLLHGPFADASVFRYDERWWILACTTPYEHHTLRLYYADDLTGPWTEHPASPVIQGNPHIARPAGRVLVNNGRIFRFSQDSYPTYGRQVWAFEITELSTSRYRERLVGDRPVLEPNGAGWNVRGMHQLDAHEVVPGRWIACVDGRGERWALSPRSLRLLPGRRARQG